MEVAIAALRNQEYRIEQVAELQVKLTRKEGELALCQARSTAHMRDLERVTHERNVLLQKQRDNR